MTAQGDERESQRTVRAHDELRAGDEDRQWVADRLRRALDQGRLGLAEYDDRLRMALHARTYAELDALIDDLPPSTTERSTAVMPAEVVAPVPAPARGRDRLPTALVVLWTIWGGVVAINVVIWLLVMVGTGELIYPWPMWVAGPTGVAMLVATVGTQQIRHRRR